MAGLNVSPDAIAEARKSGYSDAEIVGHLASADPAKFKAAADAGYSPKEVLDHLAAVKAAPEAGGVTSAVNTAVDTLAPGVLKDIAQGLQHGEAARVSGNAKTGQVYLGSDPTAANAEAAATAPKGYKPGEFFTKDAGLDPRSWNWKDVPKVVSEQAPGLAQDLAVGKGSAMAAARLLPGVTKVASPVVGLLAGLGSAAWRTLGPRAKAIAEARTGDAAAEPETQDKVKSGVIGAAEAPLNALPISRFLPGLAGKVGSVGVQGVIDSAKKVGLTAASGAVAGGANSAIDQAGITQGSPGGMHIDPREAANAAAGGALTVGAFGTPKAITDAHLAVKFKDFGGANSDAATAFANRVKAAAAGSNLTNKEAGGTAVKSATAGVQNELKGAIKDIQSRTNHGPDVDNALDAASRGEHTQNDINTIAAATQADPSAANLMHLVRQSKVASMVPQLGNMEASGNFTGGLSSKIANLVPAAFRPSTALASVGAAAFGAHVLPGLLGMVAPGALAGLYGGYGAARAIDSLTGARSPANQFVQRMSDPSVPVRQPVAMPPAAAPPAVNRPGPTGPSIPPSPQPWGSPAPYVAPTGPNPQQLQMQMNALLASRKAEGQQQNMQNKQTVMQAMPLIQRLATQPQEPPAPQPAAPAGPDPVQLRRQMDQLLNIRKAAAAQRTAATTAAGVGQANDLAATSPLISEAGGLSALSNPAMGKRASQLISAANAVKRLTAEPTDAPAGSPPAEVAPSIVPPQPMKISKANGKVTTKEAPAPKVSEQAVAMRDAMRGAEPNAEESAYTPLTNDEMPYRSMSPKDIAEAEKVKYEPKLQKVYGNKIEKTQKLRANSLIDEALAHPADEEHIGALLDQVKHITRSHKADVPKAVEHYASMMTPEGAASIRKLFTKEYIASIWGK